VGLEYPKRELEPIVHVELRIDPLDVSSDGASRDAQLAGDIGIIRLAQNGPDNLYLAA
jgi:hypothetical protein